MKLFPIQVDDYAIHRKTSLADDLKAARISTEIKVLLRQSASPDGRGYTRRKEVLSIHYSFRAQLAHLSYIVCAPGYTLRAVIIAAAGESDKSL